jgi:hypothetical protein
MGKSLARGKILLRAMSQNMNKKTILTAQILTYSGILPFLLLSIAIVAKIQGFEYVYALRAYGTLIVSFLCGIHWAVYLFFSDKCPRNLFIYSNAIVLCAYGCLLFSSYKTNYFILALCFAFLLYCDHELVKKQILPRWFFSLRCIATLAVLVILLSIVCVS